MSDEKETGTELIIMSNLTPVAVFAKEGGSESVIDSIRKQVAALNLDISTEAGRKEIKSVHRKLGSTAARMDEAKKLLKEDIQKQVNLINAEGKKIEDAIRDLQKEIKAPLDEFENKEKLRIQLREDRIAQLHNLRTPLIPDADVETIDAHLAQLAEFEVYDWQEFVMRAEATAKETRAILNGLRGARIKRDEDAAELARLKAAEDARIQKEREDQIAKDAADKAKREAEEAAEKERAAAAEREENERKAKEKAEQDAKDATARAEQAEADKKAAAEQAERDRVAAKAQAEKDAKDAADKAAQAERDRIAAEQKKKDDEAKQREADKEHRGKINRSIVKAVMKSGITEQQAIAIVTAIVKGEVPNTKITY